MAKTNWQDPGSTEIRSTHISGLQDAVGKIEESIGLDVAAETGIALSEVFISDDDRYRIYQAPAGKRNWLPSPTPVIKKNGSVISSDFEIDYGGGAVVFTIPVTAGDTLTADATYTKKTDIATVKSDFRDHEKNYILHTYYVSNASATANVYEIIIPGIISYQEGMTIAFKVPVGGGEQYAININDLGVKDIKKPDGNNVVDGDLVVGMIYTVRYNGSVFVLQ